MTMEKVRSGRMAYDVIAEKYNAAPTLNNWRLVLKFMELVKCLEWQAGIVRQR